MTTTDDQGRTEPPVGGDEAATLLGFLDFHRDTLAWKCAGLDAAGLRATHPPSTMTLGGLLKHLAYVEDYWFSCVLFDREPAAPWNAVDWRETPDWDWDSAVDDTPEQLSELWQDAVARSRERYAEALANGGLAQPSKHTRRDGSTPSLRWILVHLIEEYCRHNGHADLIRESIDGSTGE
ncbi:DinB family protein [Amycolatopsis sp. NBC_01488]|uniref:DinB family protein n=1 Tax=Amycolatopsis sp. NBC_01488 TaxID=2903563 RepID=UPI002E2A83BB|nr:DinB family protein [Amycolatopsis sp. NBC_01488]